MFSVLIVLSVELVQDRPEEKLGDPKQVMPDSAAELAQQRAAQATSTSNFYGNRPANAARGAGGAGGAGSSRAAGQS